ncbi:MAG: AAA family ATPase, partial [Actinomycetota bacterium]|nr:AAA family ATPase [Actinomycetota bacterium]
MERERELDDLGAALGEVTAGEGRAVAIEAGAGLGKTRLLQEARKAAANAGLNVLSGRATELEQVFPFALVRQLLESKIGALPRDEREAVMEGATAARRALGLDPVDDRDHDTFAVLHGLYWVTAALAERKPLLLAIDDAHTADAASLDYLVFLLPRLEELPVLLVVTGRPEEPDPSGGFRRLMTDAAVRHMSLAPLSAEATTALLARELDRDPAPPFAAACFEVSGGNPFLLSELARTLVQRGIEPLPEQAELVRGLVPERVAQTVSMRIERLPAEAGAIARSLAVLGEETDLRLVAELAGVDPAEAASIADELRASAILAGDRAPRFIHPLVRNAIYESIPAGERVERHGRAARLLRDADAGPEQVATQLLASEGKGDRGTVEILMEAGKRAIASGAPRSAVSYLSRARREPPPVELQSEVLETLMFATVGATDPAAFAAIEADVFSAIEQEPSLRSSWAVPLTMGMAMSGRFEDGTAVLRDAFEFAKKQGEAENTLIFGAQHNSLAAIAGSAPIDLGAFAAQIDPDSPAGRLAAALEAREATARGTREEAVDAARRAFGSNAAILAENKEVNAAVATMLVLVAADEVAFARWVAGRALAISREEGATGSMVRALMLSALIGWAEGDLIRAEPEMRQAMELARGSGSVPLAMLIAPLLIEILIERDELEAAERELAVTGMSSGPMPDNPMFILLLYVRGHLRVERGEFEPAVEDLAKLSVDEEGWDFGILNSSFAGPLAARALKALGDQEACRQLAESMEPLARRWRSPSTVAHVLRTRAAARNGDEAIGDLEEAAAVLADSPRLLERAHALADLGEALRRGGRRGDARAPLREALE